jgi:hypothetical protein
VVLTESIKGFAGDLAVQKEVFVVEQEEYGGGGGYEMLQMTPLDAEGAVAAIICESKGVIVDLRAS